MIDYLEDLMEEEAAVELTGQPLVPMGKRKLPFWEEDESVLRTERSPEADPVRAAGAVREETVSLPEAGGSSLAVEARHPSGAVRLLTRLNRAAQVAGVVRHQGKPLTVTLTEASPQVGPLDLETIDRTVQRDARRYDGGFSLY